MARIYIAGPLFNETERGHNVRVRDVLRDFGFDTYLPQEDGGIAYEAIARGEKVAEVRARIFSSDVEAIKGSDMLVCILDGRVPDEGMCVELGLAYALGKPCIGFSTDQRSLDAYGISLMLEGCLTAVAHSMDELLQALLPYRR